MKDYKSHIILISYGIRTLSHRITKKSCRIFKNPLRENIITQDFVNSFACIAEPGELHQTFFVLFYLSQRYILVKCDVYTIRKSIVTICTHEKCKLIKKKQKKTVKR